MTDSLLFFRKIIQFVILYSCIFFRVNTIVKNLRVIISTNCYFIIMNLDFYIPGMGLHSNSAGVKGNRKFVMLLATDKIITRATNAYRSSWFKLPAVCGVFYIIYLIY